VTLTFDLKFAPSYCVQATLHQIWIFYGWSDFEKIQNCRHGTDGRTYRWTGWNALCSI